MDTDRTLFALGRGFFAISIVFFAAQYLWYGHFSGGLMPAQAWTPAAPLVAYLTGAAFAVLGIALLVPAWAARSALIFGIALIVAVVLVNAAHVGAIVTQGSARTRAFEPLAMGSVSLVLAAALGAGGARRVALDRAGRALLGFCLVVFGVQHFLYTAFIASLIPSPVPARFDLIVMGGVAFIGAGIAIATGLYEKLASVLLGTMFLSFVPLAQLPAILARPYSGDPWTSLFVPVALCGGAWIIAGRARPSVRPQAR